MEMNRNPHEIGTGRITKDTRKVKRFFNPAEALRDDDYVQVFAVTPENARDRPRKQNRLQWLDEKLTKTQTDFTRSMDRFRNTDLPHDAYKIEDSIQQDINIEIQKIEQTFSDLASVAQAQRALCLVKAYTHKYSLQSEKSYEITIKNMYNIKEKLIDYTVVFKRTFDTLAEDAAPDKQIQRDSNAPKLKKDLSHYCLSRLKELANEVVKHVQDADQRQECINQYSAAKERQAQAIDGFTAATTAATQDDSDLDATCWEDLKFLKPIPGHFQEWERARYEQFNPWIVDNIPQEGREDRLTRVDDFLDKMQRSYNLRQFLSESNTNPANLSNEQFEELITNLTLYNHKQYELGVSKLRALRVAYNMKQPFNDTLISLEQNNG